MEQGLLQIKENEDLLWLTLAVESVVGLVSEGICSSPLGWNLYKAVSRGSLEQVESASSLKYFPEPSVGYHLLPLLHVL
ncbi:uncharacterized protein LOC144304915 isoform X2 [Canis aureus]